MGAVRQFRTVSAAISANYGEGSQFVHEIRLGMELIDRERDTQGRFAPGTSGIPAGRPLGITDKRVAVKKQLLETLLPQAIERLVAVANHFLQRVNRRLFGEQFIEHSNGLHGIVVLEHRRMTYS